VGPLYQALLADGLGISTEARQSLNLKRDTDRVLEIREALARQEVGQWTNVEGPRALSVR
jgi:hypothetical protein